MMTETQAHCAMHLDHEITHAFAHTITHICSWNTYLLHELQCAQQAEAQHHQLQCTQWQSVPRAACSP